MRILRFMATGILLLSALSAAAESPSKTAEKALAAFQGEKVEEALSLYRESLALETTDSGLAVLHFNIGACLLALDRAPESRDELMLSLGVSDEEMQPEVLYNLAHAHQRMRSKNEAMDALKACILKDPTHRKAKLFYEWLLRQDPPQDEPPPDEPPPEEPQSAPPPPNILEQLPSPPLKDLQDHFF